MISNITNYLISLIENAGVYAPLLASLLIIIESMIPVLPLFAFITINFIYFGNLNGFIISWAFTCIGCLISYFLTIKGFNKINLKDKKVIGRCVKYVNKLSIEKLSLVVAMPFTPAFAINIAAGMSNMKFSKFVPAILIGKIFMVYFWGYIGTSFIESFSNPLILIKIVILLLLAYILSIIINKILKVK